MKKVLMICTFGMSTSMFTNKINQLAKENNIPVEVYARGEGDIEHELETEEISLLLIGPQAAYIEDMIRERVAGKVPVDVIDSDDFGKQRAGKVLKQIINDIKQANAQKKVKQ